MIQMKVYDIYESYGNVEIPDNVLINLGIKREDVMLSAKEVQKYTGTSQPYKIIDVLKRKNGFSYPEKRIAKSVLFKAYGLKE